jgi:hypothetical protein
MLLIVPCVELPLLLSRFGLLLGELDFLVLVGSAQNLSAMPMLGVKVDQTLLRPLLVD